MARVTADILPATVRISGSRTDTFTAVRCAIVEGELHVYAERPGRRVELVFSGEVGAVLSAVAGKSFEVRLSTGDLVTAEKSGGCGCSSPLKRIRL